MYNGIINIYKEAGYTSHDVVAKLRGILKQKKIGHTGTLDPEATGVLPVCLGKGTKVCDLLTDKDKVYETIMRLGVVTDTQDMTGKVLKISPVKADREQIETVLNQFRGEYDQIPPMYSALKVQGKKLYELAREGKTVERKARRIHIFGLDLLEIEPDGVHVHMRIHCSKGTYIRTLCHDIGEALGCGAAMEKLVRTQVGVFDIHEAMTLAEVEACVRENTVDEKIRSIDSLFKEWPAVRVKPEDDRLLYNGNMLEKANLEPMAFSAEKAESRTEAGAGKYRVYDSQGKFCAVYTYDRRHRKFKNEKMFV